MQLIDETGNRYTRLLVLGQAPARAGRTTAFWRARCDCGTLVEVEGRELRRGSTKSCGCLQREASAYAATERARRERVAYEQSRAAAQERERERRERVVPAPFDERPLLAMGCMLNDKGIYVMSKPTVSA